MRDRAEPAGPPPIAGLPQSVWVDRYFRWRLDSVSAFAAPDPGMAAEAAPPALLPALDDPALDAVDIRAYIDRLRGETAGGGIPAGLLLAERQPAQAKPVAQRLGLRDVLRYDGAEFLRQAYRTILDREPDSSGLTAYLAQLNSGALDKIAILSSLHRSTEARIRGKSGLGRVFLLSYYRLRDPAAARYLRRRLRQAARRLLKRALTAFGRPSTRSAL